MSKPARRREQGFVLVLTIAVLATLAVAAAYFGARVQTALRLAESTQDLAEAQIALSDDRAEVLFRLATTPFSRSGLGDLPDVIRLDDRPYVDGRTVLRLQDDAGLINLNAVPDDFLGRFLGTLGVPVERQPSLVDALGDYTDADNLRRLNGAEAPQYQAIGRPDLPPNRPLISPYELRDVYGWKQEASLWPLRGGVLEFVTVRQVPGLNPNTAPWQVLTALPGVTKDIAQAIIDRRELEPISVEWLDALLGTRYAAPPSPLRGFPADSVRVTQWVPGLPWGYRYNVRLTPNGVSAPWIISYFYRLERVDDQKLSASDSKPPAHAKEIPSLPPRPAFSSSAPSILAN